MKYDEFTGQPIKEVISPNEALLAKEHEAYPEAKNAFESTTVQDETNLKVTKDQKAKIKKQVIRAITGTFVTAASCAAFGVTSLINVSMAAHFDKAIYQDGHIEYEISVSSMSNKETLLLKFLDGKSEVESYDLSQTALDAKDGIIKGKIDISTDMLDDINTRITEKNTGVTFNLTLSGNVGLSVIRTFDNYAVQFYHAESKFDKIEGECHCGVDGYYYFNIIYSDDYGIFRDFKAYIEDLEGNVAECSELNDTNAHEQHRIFVNYLKSSACKLVVSYLIDGEEEPIEVVQDINL